MSEQTNNLTTPRNSAYTEVERYLLQAEGLNLALWTSTDLDEKMKHVCWLMADLLRNIADEINNIHDEHNEKATKCICEHMKP